MDKCCSVKNNDQVCDIISFLGNQKYTCYVFEYYISSLNATDRDAQLTQSGVAPLFQPVILNSEGSFLVYFPL